MMHSIHPLRWLISAVVALFVPNFALGADTPSAPLKLDSELSDLKRPARAKNRQYKGGMIDALVHMEPGTFNEDRLPEVLQASGVGGALAMTVPNGELQKGGDTTQQHMKLAKARPDMVRVMCGGDYLSNMLAEAQRFGNIEDKLKERLERLERDLDSGLCLGVGEFGLMHFNKLGNQNVIHTQPDFPPLLKVIDIVGRRNGWIQLHAEPREPSGTTHHVELEKALSLWTQRQPGLKIILSHTGMTSAPNARAILKAYPNAYMSIKAMTANYKQWHHLEPVLSPEGELYEDWAQLMEDMPDRFFVGSDTKFGSSGHEREREEDYPKEIQRFRSFIGSLKPPVARRIASGNALHLFGFPPPKRAGRDEN